MTSRGAWWTIQALKSVSYWRSAAQLVIVLLVAGAVGTYYPRAQPSPPERRGENVSLIAERVVSSAGGANLDVVLRIGAGLQDLGPISVFWMVGTPGTERAWETPRYVASAQTLPRLSAQTTTNVQWFGTPMNLPPGTYEVTGWVHALLPSGDTQHLAGGAVGTFSVSQPVPISLQLKEQSFDKPQGPLVLESVSIDQPEPLAQRLSVQAHLRNRGTAAIGGRAQLVVNRITDPQPFRTAFWQTDWTTVPILQPGEPDTLSWNEPIGLPAGTYGLSVWLHTRNDGTWEHSHGTFNIPLKLGPNVSGIQRAYPPTSNLQIQAVGLDAGQLRLSLQGSEQAIVVSAALVSERRRFDWHLTALDPHQSIASFVLDGQAPSDVLLPVQVECAAEARFVHVTLFAAAVTEQPQPLDDVLVDLCP